LKILPEKYLDKEKSAMNIKLFLCSLLLTAGMTNLLAACEKQGPMKEAGKKLTRR